MFEANEVKPKGGFPKKDQNVPIERAMKQSGIPDLREGDEMASSWAVERTGLIEEMKQYDKKQKQFEEFKGFMDKNEVQSTWDYDYWGAFQAGDRPNKSGKWPSKWKHDLSEERFQSTNKGWLDTKETDIQGKNIYAPWTKVLTQEMKRGDEFPLNSLFPGTRTGFDKKNK